MRKSSPNWRSSPLSTSSSAQWSRQLYYGARASRQITANLATLERFFEPFESLSFDDASSVVYGQIRADLKRMGQPIGPNDMMIAAIALAHGLTVVTHNTREFGRVAGLRLEDWEIS